MAPNPTDTNNEELRKLAVELTTKRIPCGLAHPDADMFHPDGHEQTLLLLNETDLQSYIQQIALAAQVQTMEDVLLWEEQWGDNPDTDRAVAHRNALSTLKTKLREAQEKS